MQIYTDTQIKEYNRAVAQYQRACKKKRIKAKDQKYRPIQDKNATAVVLHSVEGNKELTTILTTLQALKEKLSDQSSVFELESFLQVLSVTLYRNEYPPIIFNIVDSTKIDLTFEKYGDVTISYVSDENVENRHILIIFAEKIYTDVFAKYGLSEVRPLAKSRSMQTIINLVQEETISILLAD